MLSGGEKARLALAKMLLHPTNLLVLDEPTNHLDIEACEVLEDALNAYQGTLVFVSHDRSFINALATRVVEVKAGELRSFAGHYDDYLRKLDDDTRPARAAAAVTTPPAPAVRDEPKARRSPEAATSPQMPTPTPTPTPEQQQKPATKQQRQRDRERRKLRDRLKRQIGRLEEQIHGAEAELEALGWKLGEPDLYKDVDRMRELTEARDGLEQQIAEQYGEWERLSDELAALTDLEDA